MHGRGRNGFTRARIVAPRGQRGLKRAVFLIRRDRNRGREGLGLAGLENRGSIDSHVTWQGDHHVAQRNITAVTD